MAEQEGRVTEKKEGSGFAWIEEQEGRVTEKKEGNGYA
jgi:hypothetical protein